MSYGITLKWKWYKYDFTITYNYSKFYYWFIDEEKWIRWIYWKKAKDTIKKLEFAIDKLWTNKYFEWKDWFDSIWFALDECKKKTMTKKEFEEIIESKKIYNYRCPTPWNAWSALLELLEVAQNNPEWIRSWD